MRSMTATSTAATPAATPSTTVSRPIPNLCNAAVKPPTRPAPNTHGSLKTPARQKMPGAW